MTVSIISAVASNGAIGRANALLWHLRADLKYFKEKTYGCPVIMGRRTFESIGSPLPGRLNIVVSHGAPVVPEGVICCHSLEEALQSAEELSPKCDRCFILGGAQIYAQAMPLADKLLITRVFCTPENADAFFPEIDAREWKLVSAGEKLTDQQSGLQFCFEEYGKS